MNYFSGTSEYFRAQAVHSTSSPKLTRCHRLKLKTALNNRSHPRELRCITLAGKRVRQRACGGWSLSCWRSRGLPPGNAGFRPTVFG